MKVLTSVSRWVGHWVHNLAKHWGMHSVQHWELMMAPNSVLSLATSSATRLVLSLELHLAPMSDPNWVNWKVGNSVQHSVSC